MLQNFHKRWRELPLVVVDTETTGVIPGVDAAVQIGLARFELEQGCVASKAWLVHPGRAIPETATAIHGITDAMVAEAPHIANVLASKEARELYEGVQPVAYNYMFDRAFVPAVAFDRDWPWLDSLTLVRLVDRFVRGKGRHKLEAACERHGVKLEKAHDAGADARAAGELLFKLADDAGVPEYLGDALKWFELQRTEEWHRFNDWRARQPPQETP
jgi:DNA polymerase-3 subunit epsilon